MKNRLKNSIPIGFIAVLLSAPSLQAGELLEDGGSWLQIVGEGSLGTVDPDWQKARLWLEGQSCWDNDWNHWYQGVMRAAVGYSLSERATIWAGYTWVPTQNVGKASIMQQDVWPAFRYVLPTAIGTVTLRTMLESNFGQGDEVRFRPRQMLRLMAPIGFEDKLNFVTWDEFFVRVNSTNWGGKSGFDQNRAFAGLGWSFNKNFRAELGYLNQYIEDANHVNATMHHLIMGSLFINW